jgi:hypothetical protein
MEDKVPNCVECPMRLRAEKKPKSIMARIWRWHTGWCPGYRNFQRWLAEHPEFVMPKAAEK